MTSSDALKAPASRMPLYGGVAFVAIVLTGVVVFAGAGASEAPVTHVAAPPESVSPPTSVVVAPPPPTSVVEPPHGVELVTVSFGSTPTGAEVRQGETVLCTTPCMQDLPRGEEQVVVFHHDGYFDEMTHVTPEEGTPVSVRLRPRRRVPETGSSSSIKTEI